MSDDTALLRSILDEVKAVHALLRKLDDRLPPPDAVDGETKAKLAERLERAHRTQPPPDAD